MKTLKFYLNFIILIFLVFAASAQEVIVDSASNFPFNISNRIEILEDPTTNLTLQQVIYKPFIKNNKDHFLFPYSDHAFWVRVQLSNKNLSTEEFYLLWSNPLVEQLDFYVSATADMKDAAHFRQKIITKERDKKFVDQDPRLVFKLMPGETKTIYIRLDSRRGHYGQLRLYTKAAFTHFRMNDYSSQGFLNGLMFFRLFLVLVLSFFVVKDLSFRLFSLYTLIRTFNYWGFLNIAGPLFTDDPDMAKKIDFLFYNSGTLGAGLFIVAAFMVHKLPKIHLYTVAGFVIFNIFINTVIFFDYQWYWLKLGAYGLVFSALYYILLNVYFLVKNIRFARYYSILFILGLMSTLLLYVRLLGWLEIQPIYTLSYYFFLAEFVFFVFFLGRIFRNTEVNKALTERQLKFNIEQNNKLKELDNLKTTFFTNISHEIRTPLTLITGPFQQLAEKYPSDKAIPLIQRNTDRLLTLVNQILDISKLEAGQMRPEISNQNITEYLRTLIGSYSSLAESRGIDFQWSFSKTDTYGYVDRDKLEKIVGNLLSNAFKFTPKGGTVSFRKYFDSTKKTLTLEVSDTGIGIDEEKLSKIYDRFYQADDAQNRSFEGTGIGLALVKELVDVLKGRINVESQKESGTTFRVELPIDELTWKDFIGATTGQNNDLAISIPKRTSAFEADPNIAESEKILLIVEDNEDIRQYLRSIFEGEFRILEATNGKEGVQTAMEVLPDVVISDLMMPEMDGLEFCKMLKSDEKTSHIPIVMLTAKADLDSRIEGLELGADDYLTKPFNNKEIEVRVKNLLVSREKLRERYSVPLEDLKTQTVSTNVMLDDKFMHQLNVALDSRISESGFGIENLAEVMALSSTQLRRKLKALTEQTVVEYIRNYRLKKASEMLLKNADNISEIAYRVGFDSLSYFSKVFQEIYGVSPSEYREKASK